MPDTPEAQQLVSPERLSLAKEALAGLPDHPNDVAQFQGQLGYWVQGEAKFVPCANPGTAIAYYRQRVAAADIAIDHNMGTACVGRMKLVAEHEQFRQQVAAELGRMLDKASPNSASGRAQIQDIESVAARLQLDLSPAPSA